MILRRVIQHVKKQEWTAIWIDLVIVVVGVFIGIQVANWNEVRIERELVRGHLSEIAQDLRVHHSVSAEIEDSLKMRIAAVDYIYREAFGTTLPNSVMRGADRWEVPAVEPYPLDKLDTLMGAVNLVRIWTGSRNGYQSLISSGRLGLLKNRELAHQIQTYYGKYDELLDTSLNVYRPLRNDGAREQLALGVSLLDQRPATEIVEIARANPSFAAYLRSQRELGIGNYKTVYEINANTRALLASIEQELAKP